MFTILDATMRDGAQHPKIGYSADDKLGIAEAIDSLGIDFIEYGAPAFDPECGAFEEKYRLPADKLVAFGMTAKHGIDPARDPGLKKLISCRAPYITLVGKADSDQVRNVLRLDPDLYLENIRKSVATLTENGKKVIFDAEHFFDGHARGDGYAIKSIRAAALGGAMIVALCDTCGGSLPGAIKRGVEAAKREADVTIGVHTHNDSGLAVANTLAAVEAGAEHVQGTLLGFGERCGNASLSTLIPLLNRLGYIKTKNLNMLTPVSRTVAEISNITIPDSTPFVGAAAFTHKAGLHADGVLKEKEAFELIPPESVGNSRRFVISKEAGRHLIKAKLKGVLREADDPIVLEKIFSALKKREAEGYSYEAAEASFYIMAARIAGRNVDFFETVGFSVNDSFGSPSRAEASIEVNGQRESAVAEGVGPVHALDRAMRKCMLRFFPAMDKVSLLDYKVRVIDSKSATGAKVRVSITTTDGKRTWKTLGVSANVVHASLTALEDSYRFALNDDFSSLFA